MSPAAERVFRGVSQDPDTFIAGGLPDDFKARIVEMAFEPFRFREQDEYKLFARMVLDVDPEFEIKTKAGENVVVEHYGNGSLGAFLPSIDGYEPVDIEASNEPTPAMRGGFMVPVGTRTQANNQTTWADFLLKAKAADPKVIQRLNELNGDISATFVGMYCHFSRQTKMERNIKDDAGAAAPAANSKSDGKMLAIAEVIEFPVEGGKKKGAALGGAAKSGAAAGGAVAAAKAKAAAGTKAAPKVVEQEDEAAAEVQQTEAPEASPLETTVLEIIATAATDAGGVITKADAVKKVAGGVEAKFKLKGMQIAGDVKWLRAQGFEVDAENNISLPG